MKYELIISGTKAEIEKAKICVEGWHVAWHHFSRLTYENHYHESQRLIPEFRIVEPKYRVKTLVELVTEYGEEVMVAGGYIYINGWGCSADVLGKFYSNKEAKSTWGEVFLTVSD